MNPLGTRILSFALVTATLLSATAAAHEEVESAAGNVLVQFFTQDKEGGLVLSPLPPAAKSAPAWTQEGSFYPEDGLLVEFLLENARADDVIIEESGVVGWISADFQVADDGLFGLTTFYYPYTELTWSVVEGKRASAITNDCPYEDRADCTEYGYDDTYAGEFPGHEGDGKPHTHDDADGLRSKDFDYVLRFEAPACDSLDCIFYGEVFYTLSIPTDGSTFVSYSTTTACKTLECWVPPVDATAAADSTNETDNSTDDDNSTEDGNATDDGNATQDDNSTTGNGSDEGAFEPAPYVAREAKGNAPGTSAALLIGALAGLTMFVARRRRA